jgi:hydrogenase maturation factor
MTKSAGIEGTAVLAADFTHRLRRKTGNQLLAQAKGMRRLISVVNDALIAVRVGGVQAMHDPTEGGLLQGVWELAEASGAGFRIYESRISIRPETKQICSVLKANPLKLMSSGCLLIAADRRKSSLILRSLGRRGINAAIIGTITPRWSGRKLVGRNGKVKEIGAYERDEIYRLIESYGMG